jgi:hypothetical protein
MERERNKSLFRLEEGKIRIRLKTEGYKVELNKSGRIIKNGKSNSRLYRRSIRNIKR